MISVRGLTKIYKLNKKDDSKNVVALNAVDIDFPDKGLVFLLGKSGSGKSTLLNTIGGLDTFDSGEIIIKGKSSKDFKQSDFDSYRNTFIGFIFQEYNILEEFSVGKNLSIALELQGKNADKAHVEQLLETVDLKGYYKRKPNQLSGGQKQRVAIARALIKDPEIIMADEPTGALDSNTGKQVMETLKKLSKDKLVIVVSHDREFAEIYGDRIIELKDGMIIRDEVKHEIEAVKTETGVSFIDDKIIHIKRGQKVSKDDLLKINKMILDSSKDGDTIISFDDKSNETVKKTAFITDDGNREVFKTTENSDIKRKQHNPDDFKMIKSRLKFKDSFKMGVSSLKHKPIRLIFTILLSVVAFGLFGVVDTMSSFDRAKSVVATVEQLGLKTISVNKTADYYDENYPINDEEVNSIKEKNKDYTFYKVIGSDTEFYMNNLNNNSNQDYMYTTERNRISGVMSVNQDVLDKLDIELIPGGKLPTESNEICVSKHIYDYLTTNSTFKTLDNLKTQQFDLHFNGYSKSFNICGVIEDNTNIDKYKNQSTAEMQQNHTLREEMNIIMNYSLINMCYVSQSCFDSLYSNYYMQNINYHPYFEDKEYYGGNRVDFTLINSDIDKTYIKSGIDPNNLKSNQAIVSKKLLQNGFEIDPTEIETKINEGLTISFQAGYSEKKAFDLQVVGYTDTRDYVVISDEYYNKICKGYDYLITGLKDSKRDNEKLITNIENFTSNNFRFSIQCIATPALDSLGSLIESSTKYLLWIGVGLAVFAGLMLMNFISVSIVYKKREIGVLRAIGARGKDVFSIFFSESAVICLINFVLSSIACAIVCSVINKSIIGSLGITLTLMVFGIRQIILILALSMLVAFISTFIPVFKIARKTPIDSINNR